MLEGHLVAQAFDKVIEFLGRENSISLIQELEYRGVKLNDPELKLEQISKALFDIFGDHAASLFFDMFVQELDKLSGTAKIESKRLTGKRN